eukprot:gene1452-1054_t
MLTKTKDGVTHPNQVGGDGGSQVGSLAESLDSHPAAAAGESLAGASASVGSGKSNKFSRKPPPVKDNPLFVCEPKIVLFQDYDIGNKYQRTLTFRNVSAVSRTVRILQPKSNVMHLSPLKFPPNCPNGVIAPGMSVSCTLTFSPVELGDISDVVKVETESGITGVQITAQREPPNLSIPSIINLGYCLVGDAQRSSLQCTNTGGTGKFEVIMEAGDECIEGKSLRIPPFTIYPTQFELRKGDHVDLVFEYVPLTLGQSSRNFVVRCDNGQVREFTVTARAKEIQMTYSEINSVAFDNQELVYKDLMFSHLPVGSETTQTITVINDTGLPMEYEWVWIDTKVKDKHIHTEGQRLINKRVEEQRPLTVQDSKPGTAQYQETQGHLGGAELENSIANHSLLRSIRENLEGGSDTQSHMSENSAKHDAFEILPARGVIAGEGAGEFKIVYAPRHPADISMRAVMMIKGVPFPALPSEDQPKALQKLETVGHGDFARFKSWLEELATKGTVDKYKRPNGAYSTEKGLISLSTIMALVTNYVANENQGGDLEEDILRFDTWVRKMMKHFYDFRKTAAIADDDQSLDAQSSVEEGAKQEVIFMYDWDTSSGDHPSLTAPISLYYRSAKGKGSKDNNDPFNIDADEANEEEEDDEDIANRHRAMSKDRLLTFSGDEQQVMTVIWLDAINVVKLLGDNIASVLNEKVQHEAVEYLKDCSLNNFAGVSFLVHSQVEPHRVTVQPPCVEVGGALSVGGEWHGKVELSNASSAPLELELALDSLVVKRLSQTHIDDIFEEMREVASEIDGNSESLTDVVSVHVDNPRVLLMPQTTTTVDFVLAVHALGRYTIAIPVKARDTSVVTEDIVINVVASCPQIRFDTAEIDLGLLGVGQETVSNLTFVNEGDVPAMFMMKPTIHLDNMAGGKRLGSVLMPNGGVSGSNTARSQQGGGGVPLSGRSTLSRASSIHSDDFSVADSQASVGTTDFKIDIKNAIVSVEPSNGVVEPGQSMTVQVRGKAGKQPQRIRGMIETRVFDASGKIEAHKQFLNLRGEVQAPKVLLYPMHHTLGQVFVGRPVKFAFTLENICNLPTKFKFQRPGGTSSMYSYTLTPAKGSLGAKEKLVVEGTFTALMPGVIDDCLACKMFGISLPLGIGLKAVAKGIQLEFLSLEDKEALPEPIAPPDCVQYPHGDKAPEPRPPVPINLGEQVPLYQRRYGRLVIRNLSAIPAPIELKVKKFIIVEKPKRFSSSQSVESQSVTSSIGAKEREDLVLAPHEDGTNRFQSQAGKDYIGAELHRREDRKFLQSGLGASYFLEHGHDIIPPWGVHEVIVHAFNDIPGVYDDEVEVNLQEGEVLRKMNIPLIMRVEGCPIVIEKSTLGITVVDRAYKGPPEWFGKQLLQLGQACEHTGDPLHREFYVRNCGSKPGVIKWTIRGIASKAYGPIKVSLAVDHETGKVKTKYRFWDDIAKESPFKIEPMMAVLPAYGREKFHVTLLQATPAQVQRANLSAQIVVQEDEGSIATALAGPLKQRPGHTAPPSSVPASITSSALLVPPGAQLFNVDLFVEGSLVHPQLVVDKHAYEIAQADTYAKDHQALKLKAKATLLFASAGKPSDICYRLVEVTNPLETTVVVTTSVDGPYVIKDAAPSGGSNKGAGGVTAVERSSSAPGKSHKPRTGGITAAAAAPQTRSPERAGSPNSAATRNSSPPPGGASSSVSMGTFGRIVQLLPHIIASFGGDAGKPTEARGDLIFSYPTGQKLHVPLVTSISTPFITGSSPRLYFGICHVRQQCQAMYLISNPTDVPARWTVTHVPHGGAWKPASAIRVKGFEQIPEEDDPEVFTVTPNAGSVEGPTVSIAAAMAAPPKDYNRAPLENSVVPERLVQASWATNTLTIKDAVDLKHKQQHQNEADACFPMPITIHFHPKRNVRYCSRFRFSCEFANSFDLVVQGEGTYEEHEHRPLNPIPR